MKKYIFTKVSKRTATLSDPLWESIPKAYLDWEGFNPAPGYASTYVEGIYSEDGITLFFDSKEPPCNVLARYKGKNDPVCRDSCVEFFVTPDPLSDAGYINFELSAGGGLHIGLGKERKGREHPEFEMEDFEIETSVYDDGWKAKLFIPFRFVKDVYGEFRPKFKGNFYKCGDETARVHYITWNPVDVSRPDYHRPEFFGDLYFG